MSDEYRAVSEGLNESEVKSDPIEQFNVWFQQAVQYSPGEWFLPEAMTLATSANNRVSARVVLLKQADQSGFVFYTNYESLKGDQLAANDLATLVFYWPYLARQVRIEGCVKRVTRNESAEYFHSRPKGSQVGAIVSDQSRVIESREWLQQRYDRAQAQYEQAQVPLPDCWGGYCLQPNLFEFWQGRVNRLHDRLRYLNESGQWQVQRLAP